MRKIYFILLFYTFFSTRRPILRTSTFVAKCCVTGVFRRRSCSSSVQNFWSLCCSANRWAPQRPSSSPAHNASRNTRDIPALSNGLVPSKTPLKGLNFLKFYELCFLFISVEWWSILNDCTIVWTDVYHII